MSNHDNESAQASSDTERPDAGGVVSDSESELVAWVMRRADARDLLGWLRQNRPPGMPDRTLDGLVDALAGHKIPATEKPWAPPTGPNQPKTKGELLRALGGDVRAMQDPYVKRLLAALPEEPRVPSASEGEGA
jgi:hypothetical protein